MAFRSYTADGSSVEQGSPFMPQTSSPRAPWVSGTQGSLGTEAGCCPAQRHLASRGRLRPGSSTPSGRSSRGHLVRDRIYADDTPSRGHLTGFPAWGHFPQHPPPFPCPGSQHFLYPSTCFHMLLRCLPTGVSRLSAKTAEITLLTKERGSRLREAHTFRERPASAGKCVSWFPGGHGEKGKTWSGP